jgi:hypothetical protein
LMANEINRFITELLAQFSMKTTDHLEGEK